MGKLLICLERMLLNKTIECKIIISLAGRRSERGDPDAKCIGRTEE